jgi:hypothetical protein
MNFEEFTCNIPLLHTWDGGATWNAGGFEGHHLHQLHAFLRERLPDRSVLLETGAGNSTIAMLFLNPARLVSIAPELPLFDRIRAFCREHGIDLAALEVHADGSEWVLPHLAAACRGTGPILDFALIDGCHGWPISFVDLQYSNAMLRQGGYVMIDDVQLHTGKEAARLLAEHSGFLLDLDLGKSIVFRKLTDERHLGEWTSQPYVVRRTEEYARWANPFAL